MMISFTSKSRVAESPSADMTSGTGAGSDCRPRTPSTGATSTEATESGVMSPRGTMMPKEPSPFASTATSVTSLPSTATVTSSLTSSSSLL